MAVQRGHVSGSAKPDARMERIEIEVMRVNFIVGMR